MDNYDKEAIKMADTMRDNNDTYTKIKIKYFEADSDGVITAREYSDLSSLINSSSFETILRAWSLSMLGISWGYLSTVRAGL